MRCGFTRTYTLSITRHTSIGSVLRRLFLQFCLSSDVESRTRSSTDYCTAAAASTVPVPAAAAPAAPAAAPAHKGPDEYGKARFSSPCLSFSFPACCRIFMSLVFSFSLLLLHLSCLSSSLPAYRCRGSDHPRLFLRPPPRPHLPRAHTCEVLLLPACLLSSRYSPLLADLQDFDESASLQVAAFGIEDWGWGWGWEVGGGDSGSVPGLRIGGVHCNFMRAGRSPAQFNFM